MAQLWLFIKPFGEREHRRRDQQQRGGNADQAQPPRAHPMRVVGVYVGHIAEIRVQTGTQQEPE